MIEDKNGYSILGQIGSDLSKFDFSPIKLVQIGSKKIKMNQIDYLVQIR